MKILYINTFNPYLEKFGGSVVTKLELDLLKNIYDVDTLFADALFKRVTRYPFKIILQSFLTTLSYHFSIILLNVPKYWISKDLCTTYVRAAAKPILFLFIL